MEPDPLKTIPEEGSRVALADDAVTVRSEAGVSRSATVNEIGPSVLFPRIV